MTQVHDIDLDHAANSRPNDATVEEIADELAGRQLYNRPLLMQFDGWCERCREKNQRRQAVGVEKIRKRILDGEAVQFFAYYVPPEEIELEYAPPGYWRISKVICAEHPRLPFEDVTCSDTIQVRGRANLEVSQGDGYRLVNVSVEERSPIGEGPAEAPAAERVEEYVTDGSGSDPAGVIDVPVDEPEPTWPAEEREWLDELVDEHGPIEPSDPAPAVIELSDIFEGIHD